MVDLQDSGILQDITGDMTPPQAILYLRKRIDAILTAAQTCLDAVQMSDKEEFYNAIWFTPHISPGYYTQLDQIPKEKHEAEEIAPKLLPHYAGPTQAGNAYPSCHKPFPTGPNWKANRHELVLV